MTITLKRKNNFTTDLIVKKLPKGKWEVKAPFEYHLIYPNGEEFVRVPIGFITDFASIPFPFSHVFSPVGKDYDKPAVIHDKLYQYPFVTTDKGIERELERNEVDKIFKEAMEVEELEVNWFTRRSLYQGVRIGGWKVWNKYRALELNPAAVIEIKTLTIPNVDDKETSQQEPVRDTTFEGRIPTIS